jgi:hypothetical protein
MLPVALLDQTKSMYNATLSLAAFHQRATLPRVKSPSVGTSADQERFYSLALRGLRHHIGILNGKDKREGLRDSIHILSCANQLIMSEVSPVFHTRQFSVREPNAAAGVYISMVIEMGLDDDLDGMLVDNKPRRARQSQLSG